jgi:hypothetical protein
VRPIRFAPGRARWRAPALLVALLFAVPSRADDAPVSLAPRFPEAQVRYLTLRTETEKLTVVSFFPDPIGTLDQREWWIIATTGPAAATAPSTAPDSVTLTWKIDRLQALHRDRVGREQKPDMLFDSLRPSNPPQTHALVPWGDRTITLRLNDDGRVVDSHEAPGAPRAAPTPAHGASVEQPTLDELRRVAGELYGSCSAGKPVAVGDSWVREYSVHRSPYGTLSGPIHYTLRGMDESGGRRVARVAFGGELTLTPDAATTRPGADSKRHEVRRAVFEGTAEFDVAAGQPIRVETNEVLDLNLIMSSAQPATPPAKPTASGPATQPATQGELKTTTYTFRMSETRKCVATVSAQAPVKPIVVRPATPTQPAAPASHPVVAPPPIATRPAPRLNPISPATTRPVSDPPS